MKNQCRFQLVSPTKPMPRARSRSAMGSTLLAGLLALCTQQAQALTHVIGSSPTRNALQQPLSPPVVIQFDSAIDPTTVTPATFLVWGEWTGKHVGTLSFTAGNTAVTFVPGTPFASGETVRMEVSSRVKDA